MYSYISAVPGSSPGGRTKNLNTIYLRGPGSDPAGSRLGRRLLVGGHTSAFDTSEHFISPSEERDKHMECLSRQNAGDI
ncbi:MAG: hypothetical protein UU88_C0007G0004 [Parcubacteria group bacterium GW2011_GWC1_42_11]|uniref:Uncharacterized protein n=1 Tax=Candidatus Nomurabacteria bacterium GW2011_GWC2_42_20 TaxID=1618756 RepID=A0A0G0ZFK6_9BACT|nr:MAG: hypothetical protein UU88_C0007G0004 [Parcubacteria group bacterium GW2011_GWC1_42_11]KKS47464.1 MAG: hypothetical protein UV12_C0007G0004 [Candidatus Nomurabacteria bacterium GW2011_GWC2_42_20]HBH71337.1 hypothetical protein [Candidatus Yonathbacteria bacterium]